MEPNHAERVDLYNAQSNPLGRTIRRGEPLAPGEYHLVVQVWVRISRGEFLVQKRRSALAEAPGVWATAAGWGRAGEDSRETAVREVGEEPGIRVSPGELRAVLGRTVGATLGSAWILNRDVPREEIVPDPDEVTGTMWASESRIRSMVRDGGFFDCGTEHLDRLFGM